MRHAAAHVRFGPIGDIALSRSQEEEYATSDQPSVSPGGTDMKLSHRRQFLHMAAGAAALPAVSRIDGASLSVAAGAHRRRPSSRRCE